MTQQSDGGSPLMGQTDRWLIMRKNADGTVTTWGLGVEEAIRATADALAPFASDRRQFIVEEAMERNRRADRQDESESPRLGASASPPEPEKP